jgi:hypothetical protein
MPWSGCSMIFLPLSGRPTRSSSLASRRGTVTSPRSAALPRSACDHPNSMRATLTCLTDIFFAAKDIPENIFEAHWGMRLRPLYTASES